jgi:hypothetical protein
MNEMSYWFPNEKEVHRWIFPITVCYVRGFVHPPLEAFTQQIINSLHRSGHKAVDHPQDGVDLILTTSEFGYSLNWRQALMFTSRKRFGLKQSPMVVTLMWATKSQFSDLVNHFTGLVVKETAIRDDYPYPGLAPDAYLTLHEQNKRGGPLLAISRLIQVWAKSIRVILVVGDDEPIEAYFFDLVGMHPRISFLDAGFAFTNLANRLATVVCTKELVSHEIAGTPLPQAIWQDLPTPDAMRNAGRELGARGFFTDMVQVDHLAVVPAVKGVIASQYSEGCFATWDPVLKSLISTVTGSARPVEKDNLADDDLSVVTGIRNDGLGALVRQVEGLRNAPPSSEAVEMILADMDLPVIVLDSIEWNLKNSGLSPHVPVIRSKLHGHRGVSGYDPQSVEFVPLDTPFYDYPVSCSTEAQAQAIRAAFSRSLSLQNPEDTRQVVFTVLPGHGAMIVEKWIPGKKPFQIIWEMMDAGKLQIDRHVPQGRLAYILQGKQMVLVDLEELPR